MLTKEGNTITPSDQKVVQFSRGVPPLEAIPTWELAAHAAAVLEEGRDVVFQYAPLGRNPGDPALREQLGAFHAVHPDRVFVGNGSLQVLDLLAAHLLREGTRAVYVEAPTYDRAVQIFERHGGQVIGLPVERDSLDIEALQKRLRALVPTFLYTIPDFQNPSGVTLTQAKRQALVDLAGKYGFTVVEDIPYRELRYHGATPSLLGAVAREARVITVGSLTKILSPGLRVGYAISDRETSLALAALAENTYLSPAPLCQAIAARCLASGVVRENIDRVRNLLRPRHDAAVAATRRLLGDALLAVPDGGYFLGVHLRAAANEATLLAAARAQGVVLTPGSAFYPPSAPLPAGTLFVRLPFQALDPGDFAAGVERLVNVAERISC
jgi:DNA-binding transcriptional MocR family regulator